MDRPHRQEEDVHDATEGGELDGGTAPELDDGGRTSIPSSLKVIFGGSNPLLLQKKLLPINLQHSQNFLGFPHFKTQDNVNEQQHEHMIMFNQISKNLYI
ncbi:hypothetical protein HanRHA438_Chr04g0199161 [Helianthus annuus]|nr:hypothetical protein HanIR_Chr04g0204091 [Helianthus annuus]KAJ0928908.1 hypothetical protein HanRHA438_Chr04g0199161 [Helianthus annuus]